MKKLVVLAAAIFTSYFAQAQTGITYGLKAGVNYSTISADNDKDLKFKPGIHVGGFAEYSLSDMFSIRPELLYSRKGSKYNFNVSEVFEDEEGNEQSFNGKVDADMNFQYIDLPVLARVKAGNLFFEAGPTFSYLLKAKSDYSVSFTGGGMDLSYNGTENSTKDMNRLDVGYAAGLGYELPSGIGVSLRYNGGLSDINKEKAQPDEELPTSPSGKMTNSVFQFYLSYRLGRN